MSSTEQQTITVPSWMNHEFDYIATWDEQAKEWKVIPF